MTGEDHVYNWSTIRKHHSMITIKSDSMKTVGEVCSFGSLGVGGYGIIMEHGDVA